MKFLESSTRKRIFQHAYVQRHKRLVFAEQRILMSANHVRSVAVTACEVNGARFKANMTACGKTQWQDHHSNQNRIDQDYAYQR
jgi:hypothetical protein